VRRLASTPFTLVAYHELKLFGLRSDLREVGLKILFWNVCKGFGVRYLGAHGRPALARPRTTCYM